MTYQACYLPKAPGYNQVLEVMFHNKKLFDGGLIWFHLRPCLQKHTETYQYWYEKAKDRFMPLENFKKCNYSKLKKRKLIHTFTLWIYVFLFLFCATPFDSLAHIGELETRRVSRKDEFARFRKIQNRVWYNHTRIYRKSYSRIWSPGCSKTHAWQPFHKKRIVHIYTVFHFERTNGLCTFSYRWKIHRGVYSQYL